MLKTMRGPVAKILTVVLFGLLILSFAVWGIGDIFRTGGRVSTVAEVGGRKIDQTEFSRDLAREMNRLRQRFGGEFDIAQAQALGVVDQVLQQLVTRTAFDQQAADMGLLVSEDQIKERIRTEPAFQNDLGDFEKARFYQILRSNNLTEQQFVQSLTHDITRQQMVGAVTDGVEAPQTLAEALYAYQQERRIGETVTVTVDSLPALPEPTDEDLGKVHGDHAGRFKAPEYRAVSLIYLKADDLAEEVSVSEEQLREEFEARQDEFRIPEQRALSQIVLSDEAQAREAQAKLEAGQSLAEVAQAVLGREPVDLGKMTLEDLAFQLPELAKAAFALEMPGLSAPVETPLGWHIVEVSEIEAGQEPSLDAAREELAYDLAMRQAVDSLVSIANELDDELGSGATLEEAAEVLSLEIHKIEAMDAGGKTPADEVIEGLPPIAEFAPAVFQTEPADDSLLNETRDGNYFVIRVDSVAPAAERSLDEVREAVTALWQDLERERLLREKAEALAAQAREGRTLEGLAEAEGLTYSATDPIARQEAGTVNPALRELSAKLFDIADGEVTTAASGEDYIVAKLIKIDPADISSKPDEVDALRGDLAESLRADLLSGFVGSLREELGVAINPAVLQDALTAF
jgi:peptidyl-prolyl cis-trans isomerase D